MARLRYLELLAENMLAGIKSPVRYTFYIEMKKKNYDYTNPIKA